MQGHDREKQLRVRLGLPFDGRQLGLRGTTVMVSRVAKEMTKETYGMLTDFLLFKYSKT